MGQEHGQQGFTDPSGMLYPDTAWQYAASTLIVCCFGFVVRCCLFGICFCLLLLFVVCVVPFVLVHFHSNPHTLHAHRLCCSSNGSTRLCSSRRIRRTITRTRAHSRAHTHSHAEIRHGNSRTRSFRIQKSVADSAGAWRSIERGVERIEEAACDQGCHSWTPSCCTYTDQ